MRGNRRIAAALLALALALPAGVAAQVQRGNANDRKVQEEVNRKLHEKDKLKNVNAAVEDGIVTLTGSVNLFMDKVNAEKRARSVDNVAGIRDRIQVTSQASDAELQSKLADKLRYDRVGYGIVFNNLTLKVNNGIVTVGGNVHDYPDRESALAVVETTPGVKGVVDNIDVAPTSIHDDELRVVAARAIYGHSALQRYALDPQAPIRIVVNNGNIELYGVVDSPMDKQIAEVQARSVPGAFSVKNHLVVAGQQAKQK